MKRYPTIDIYGTGQKIKKIMQRQGRAVSDVQEYLGLATPQSIYHWFSGRNMPTIDNLYALSELFHVPIDMMLCGNRKAVFHFSSNSSYNRLYAYYEKFRDVEDKYTIKRSIIVQLQ